MTEPGNPSTDRPESAAQVQLDYAPPTGGLPPAVQLTLGVTFALAVMIPLTFLAPIAIGMIGAILGPLVGIAIMGSVAFILRRSGRRRALAAGIWIGIGIAILADGICWMAVSQMRF